MVVIFFKNKIPFIAPELRFALRLEIYLAKIEKLPAYP